MDPTGVLCSIIGFCYLEIVDFRPIMPPKKERAKKSTPAKASGSNSRKRKAPLQPPTRSRLGISRSILSPGALADTLNNLTSAQQKVLQSLIGRPFVPCKCFDIATLGHLNIVNDMERFFNRIGWSRFMHIDYPTYEELCYEFYATFQFNKMDGMALDTPGVIQFQLIGQTFDLSINEFNLYLGFVSETTLAGEVYFNNACDLTQRFANNYVEIWREWSTDTQHYDSSQSRASFFSIQC